MSLKRGVERVACDYCYRRKIKCDRKSRAEQHREACSQCASHAVPCTLNDPENRPRKREERTLDGASMKVSIAAPPSTLSTSDTGTLQRARHDLAIPQQNVTRPLTPISAAPQGDHVGSIAWDQSMWDAVIQQNAFTGPSTDWNLSAESASFLDQIFVDQPAWLNIDAWQAANVLSDSDHVPSSSIQHTHRPNTDFAAASCGIIQQYEIDGVNCSMLESAFRKYFEVTAPSLPVLVEEAFWTGYRSGATSSALVFAVACRGMAFSNRPDKWQRQQLLAAKFRESFLDHQHTESECLSVRLDDLEALTLMIEFKYDRTFNTTAESRLGALFLTHDCLVLMTINFHLEERKCRQEASDELRGTEDKRRKLLYWHVFGLDAFRSLDCKVLSRIRDDANEHAPLPQSAAKDYLDSILALAIVARKLVASLCSSATRRRGIHIDDLVRLYESLQDWRKTIYEPWDKLQLLRVGNSPTTATTALGETTLQAGANKTRNLQNAVLKALEANCYLQIESCVQQYGVEDQKSLRTDMIVSSLRYHTLRSVTEVITIAEDALAIHNDTSGVPSWTDASPYILRDIFAGTCSWLCFSDEIGSYTRYHGLTYPRTSSEMQARRQERCPEAVPLECPPLVMAAKTLRRAVASAVSHSDTSAILQRLDDHIEILENKSIGGTESLLEKT